MATGNKCSQPHTSSPRHGGSAVPACITPCCHWLSQHPHSWRMDMQLSPRRGSCPLAEEDADDADDGNQQTLEPGPLSMKPPVLTDGLLALPQPRLCRGRSTSAHHGCPALGPPASSQWADSVSRVTRPLGRPFHSGSLLPRSPGP